MGAAQEAGAQAMAGAESRIVHRAMDQGPGMPRSHQLKKTTGAMIIMVVEVMGPMHVVATQTEMTEGLTEIVS